VLFIDKEPQYDEDGKPLYDYMVKRVAKSLTVLVLGGNLAVIQQIPEGRFVTVQRSHAVNLPSQQVIVTDDLSCPIDENTVLFIDKEPQYDEDGKPLYAPGERNIDRLTHDTVTLLTA